MPKKLIKITDFDVQHYITTERYARAVDKLFDTASLEFSILASNLTFDSSKPFSFRDYPRTAAKVKEILVKLNRGNIQLINKGVEQQWLASCEKNEAFIQSIFDTTKLTRSQLKQMQDKNLDALKQFQKRKVGGLGLSERVWKTSRHFQQQIEFGLDEGIGKGKSAIQIASKVKRNLKDPDKLFRRVRDKHGALVASSAAKAFHPGRGVYKSSARNAQRLTRTEINGSYRESDWLRWQSLDFVIGFEIKRTQREDKCNCKVCESLKGRYPKWFKWVGWHPQCMCYAIPILASLEDMEDQMLSDFRSALYGKTYRTFEAKNVIDDVPQQFKDWVQQNIDRQKGWKSSPYFIRDNFKDGLLHKGLIHPESSKVQKQIERKRTRAEEKLIRERWANRARFRVNTIKAAERIISVAKNRYALDTSLVEQLIKEQRYKNIREAARALAKKVEQNQKQIKNIGKLIPNAKSLVSVYGLAALTQLHKAVSDKMESWKGLPLSKLVKKLKFEIQWVEDNKKYDTWKEAQEAYKQQLNIAENKLAFETLTNDISFINEYLKGSKSSILQKQYEEIQKAKTLGNIEEAKALIGKAFKKINSLENRKAANKTEFPKSAYSNKRKDKAFWEKQSSEKADEAFRGVCSKVWRGLTLDERKAAYRYTAGSSYINEPLRGLKYTGQYLGKYDSQKDINRLTKAVKRSRYDFDVWIQRGVTRYGAEQLLGLTLSKNTSGLVGKIVTEKAFSSCSAVKGKGFSNKEVIYNIYCPKGTQMLYCEPFSEYGASLSGYKWDGITPADAFKSEMEMLLQRNTAMRITKVEFTDNKWYIDMEVVSQKP